VQEGFSITMKGSEIQAHVHQMVARFEEEARRLEDQITKERQEAHAAIDKQLSDQAPRSMRGPQPCSGLGTEQLVQQRLTLLEAVRKHVALASHIEPDEVFRLKRDDILFLRLTDAGFGPSVASLPAIIGA